MTTSNKLAAAADTPRVDLVVERQWHVGPHAAALQAKGWLQTVHGGFPPVRYLALGIPKDHLRCHPRPAVWNLLRSRARFLPLPGINEPRALAQTVARKGNLARFQVVYASAYRYLFPSLRERDHVLVIERGSTHPADYFHAVEQGKQEAGQPHSADLPGEIREEIKAGELAHFIVAGSAHIRDSYLRHGHHPSRILTIPYGTDPDLFRYLERNPPAETLRVACVGIIGIRKGIARLLRIAEWAGRRNISVQLVLVGPLEPETPAMLSTSRANIEIAGVLKGRELVEKLHSCDLYCLPSYEEGFGISVIEAMSTGLPAVVSQETGAREVIVPGVNGNILEDYGDSELDEKILPLLSQPQIRQEAGRQARSTVEKGYTHRHYAATLHREYERMFEIVGESMRANTPLRRGLESEL